MSIEAITAWLSFKDQAGWPVHWNYVFEAALVALTIFFDAMLRWSRKK